MSARRRRMRWALASLAVLAAVPLVLAQPPADDAAAARARLKERQLSGPPSKPVAPFAVEHRFAAEPALGQPLAIELTVRALATVANVTVTVSAPQDLALAAVPALGAATLGRGEALTGTVEVTPLAAGTTHLAVLVEGDAGGMRQARNVSIRIAVPGSEAPRTAPRAESQSQAPRDDAGQTIHVLPAEERSSRE